MTLKEVIENMDIKEFLKQKEWLAKITSEDSETLCAQGLLHFMDSIQDAAEEELKLDFSRYDFGKTDEVTELCPNCEREVTLTWNVREDGLKAFCPHCGERLMLCATCPSTEGKFICDYDDSTDSCRYNDKAASKMNTVIKYLYRDASNFKKNNRVIIPGLMTEEQKKRIWDSLFDGEYFIPDAVGLPEERYYGSVDDHSFFELEGFDETSAKPNLILKADDLVKEFEKNKDHWEISLE